MSTEASIRLISFIGIFAAIALWELASPRRSLTISKSIRWFSNIGIIIINTAILRGLFPVAAVSVAANNPGMGLLNSLNLPFPMSVAIGILALDLIIYLQHVIFHAVPIFWRLHKMHHADLDIDVTTGLRFHPMEVILSMGIKIIGVLIIGPPVLAVIVFEVLLNGTSMFNHGNISMPFGVDRLLRLIVVTPDMHRVHHSVIIKERNSNYGFNFPWWDRLFRTYKSQPAAGHEGMVIGLAQFRDQERLTLPWLLALPFIRKQKIHSR